MQVGAGRYSDQFLEQLSRKSLVSFHSGEVFREEDFSELDANKLSRTIFRFAEGYFVFPLGRRVRTGGFLPRGFSRRFPLGRQGGRRRGLFFIILPANTVFAGIRKMDAVVVRFVFEFIFPEKLPAVTVPSLATVNLGEKVDPSEVLEIVTAPSSAAAINHLSALLSS